MTLPSRRCSAFISYRHADNLEMGRKWANWLHEALESYEVPPDLIGKTSLRGDKVPASVEMSGTRAALTKRPGEMAAKEWLVVQPGQQ